MSSYPTFSPSVIGQAEKTLNAILDRQLAGTGLTEPQWVILTVTVTGGGTAEHGQLARQVGAALKISQAQARERIGALVSAGMLRADAGQISVTDAGQQLHRRVRVAVSQITERLWGDLPAEDLAIAGRLLGIVTERANAELGEYVSG